MTGTDDIKRKWGCEATGSSRLECFFQKFPHHGELLNFWVDIENIETSAAIDAYPFYYHVSKSLFGSGVNNPIDDLLPSLTIDEDKFSFDVLSALIELERRWLFETDSKSSATAPAIRRHLMSSEPGSLVKGEEIDVYLDGFGINKACYKARLDDLGKSLSSCNLILFRDGQFTKEWNKKETKIPMRNIFHPNSERSALESLSHILLHEKNCAGGYAWGDTFGEDGGYAADDLCLSVVKGFARITGNRVGNGLGGTWPEVEVTRHGALALNKSGLLIERVKSKAYLETEHGELEFDVESGFIVTPVKDETGSEPLRVLIDDGVEIIENDVIHIDEISYLRVDGLTKERDDNCFRARPRP